MEMIVNLLKGFVNMLKYPAIIALAICAFMAVLVVANIFILHHKGYRFKRGNHVKLKRKSVVRRLLIDAPYMIAKDMIEHDPEFFKYQGMVIFTGRQGRGKTVALVEFMRRMQQEYLLAKCLTNLNYQYQDDILGHWKDMINYKNGIQGVIVGMDETQNWFSSNNSRNFPPEMLQEITQNRKQRRIILGTAQSFHLLAKAIRTQATEVRECMTIARCITFVRRREPILDAEGNVVEYKNRGFYFFVHTDEIRKSYDTYSTVNAMVDAGFQDRDYLVENGIVVNLPEISKKSSKR